jgi:hypothetical protein
MMNEDELDDTLLEVAARVRSLSRRVHYDPAHKARLREDLLRRHHERSRARVHQFLGLRLPARRMGRAGLVAAPALVVALAATMMLWFLPVSGHQNAQAAMAQRITRALTRTAPTVTAWQWTLHRKDANGKLRVIRLRTRPFGPYQRLYVKNGRTYLYYYGKWQLVSASVPRDKPQYFWVWAFAQLPERMATQHFSIVGERSLSAHLTVGLRYTLATAGNKVVLATAWVDENTGLVVQLVRTTTVGGRQVQRDVADYHYRRVG